MHYRLILLFILASSGWAQTESAQQAPPKQPKLPPPLLTPQPERVEVSGPAPAASRPVSAEPGQMEPAQVQALLHNIWLSEYRINDLVGEVRPERWKVSDAARNSFSQTLLRLRAQVGALEEWRSQFEKRTDSIYLGFETYRAINAVLPRLDGVARGISQHENASLAAQYTQAGNRLFDLQQAMEPYLSLLLRNQDQLFLAMQTNLAACQNQLGYAMRASTQPATPLKNVLPNFKGHPPLHRTRIVLEFTEPTETARGRPGRQRAISKRYKVDLPGLMKGSAPAPAKPQLKKP